MASDVDALCARIVCRRCIEEPREKCRVCDPETLANDVRAALESRGRRIEELRDRADRLRLALVYSPTYRKRCPVCVCTWVAGEEESHDADCIAAPTVKHSNLYEHGVATEVASVPPADAALSGIELACELADAWAPIRAEWDEFQQWRAKACLKKYGARDTDDRTPVGKLFDSSSPRALCAALDRLELATRPSALRKVKP